MRHPVVAKINTETEGSAITYDAGMVLGKAISADINWTRNDNPLYADDVIAEDDNGITGGTIDIRSLAGNIITPAEEGPADTTFCMGISVDADLTQKGGAATLTALGPEARNLNVKGTSTRTAGTLDLIRAPWQLDPDAYQYDMSAYAQVISAEGAILAAYDDLALGAFIGDDCVGYAVFLSNLGLLRIHANTPDAQAITFRLYNYADEKESNLTPVDAEGKAIAAPTFAATTLLGTPKAPLLLALAAVRHELPLVVHSLPLVVHLVQSLMLEVLGT
jgi:hypothetical protein